MKLVSAIFAITLASSATAAQASESCAAYLLSYPGSAAEQSIGLSDYQLRQINGIRSYTSLQLSKLNMQLRQVNYALTGAVHPLRVRRLQQQRASLIAQINNLKTSSAARIAAVLTPWQRRSCGAPIAYYPPPRVKVYPPPVRRPYYNGHSKRRTRPAPPPVNYRRPARNHKRPAGNGYHKQPAKRGNYKPAPRTHKQPISHGPARIVRKAPAPAAARVTAPRSKGYGSRGAAKQPKGHHKRSR